MKTNGKGDSPRPRNITEEEWEENFFRIFGKKETKPESEGETNNPYVCEEDPSGDFYQDNDHN